jgi:hypothetical protein
VCDDAPEAFTYSNHYFVVSQPWVHDFGRHAVWTSYAKDTWIDRGEARATAALRGIESLWSGALADDRVPRGQARR